MGHGDPGLSTEVQAEFIILLVLLIGYDVARGVVGIAPSLFEPLYVFLMMS
jgi:hypothetical protein